MILAHAIIQFKHSAITKKEYYSFLLITVVIINCLFSCEPFSTREKSYEPTFSVDTPRKTVLSFAVPYSSYYDFFGPFINCLNSRLTKSHIQIAAAKSYEDFINRLRKKEFDFTILNGLTCLDLEQNGYTIVCKVENDSAYRGIIVVNKDSGINKIHDLVGKTISSPGKDAVGGHMMPMYFLHQNGLNIKKDIGIIYQGSFESVYLNVYQGNCTAGFGMLTNWKAFLKNRPEIGSRVELKWTTFPLQNVAIIFRNDINAEVAEELKALIFSLHTTVEGKKALEHFGGNKFVPANTRTYSPMKKFLREYNSIMQ